MGLPGSWGLRGHKGQRGSWGRPVPRASVAPQPSRWAGAGGWLHSAEASQAVPFDTELVNLQDAFDLVSGHFLCTVPGVYVLSLTVHTWNHRETYLHIMCNRQATALLYSQPIECSVMQTHSLLLTLASGDTVWVRTFQRDQANTTYGGCGDLCVTFSGHLAKPATQL